MKVLIAYATTEGQTRKIADWIADRVRQAGHDVTVIDCRVVDDKTVVANFDLAILAGSLHMEKHQIELERFAQRNRAVLQEMPSVFLSVSGSGSRTDEASKSAAQWCIQEFVNRTGWTPGVSQPVGGAIKYTQYNFILRAVMKYITARNGGPTDTSRDHELTDWTALGAFIDRVLQHPPKPAGARSAPDPGVSASPTGHAAPG